MGEKTDAFNADGRPGRRPIPTRYVLEVVLWILNTGAQWHMLPQSYPNYKSVHWRFQTWCRDAVLRRVLMDVANELRDKHALDEVGMLHRYTFVMAKGGGAEIGPTKRPQAPANVSIHGAASSVSAKAACHSRSRSGSLTSRATRSGPRQVSRRRCTLSAAIASSWGPCFQQPMTNHWLACSGAIATCFP
jgi:transposase